MKILFICGALEPGKDGVGDYTMLLSGELLRQGHSVQIVSINDRYIKADINEVTVQGDLSLTILRLASSGDWGGRMVKAKKFVDDFNPDWLSLQYVPFSFNDKGLSFGLGARLKTLGKGRTWHIMFHELWGGINNNKKNSFKNIIFYYLQKKCVLYNLQTIRPSLITTSISIYQSSLKKYTSYILPLFSNIRFAGKYRDTKNDPLQVVNFGTFSGDLDEFNNQLNWLKNTAAKEGKKINFITFGNGGQFKLPSLNLAKSAFGDQNVSDLGLLPAEEISNILGSSDIGISRADGLLWGKSGTTMAMLEHGLPVVLKGQREALIPSFSDFGYEALLYFPNDSCAALPAKTQPVEALPKVAKQLYELYKTKK